MHGLIIYMSHPLKAIMTNNLSVFPDTEETVEEILERHQRSVYHHTEQLVMIVSTCLDDIDRRHKRRLDKGLITPDESKKLRKQQETTHQALREQQLSLGLQIKPHNTTLH